MERNFKCTGYQIVNADEEIYNVMISCGRDTLYDIRKMIIFAIEQSENAGFIMDGVDLIRDIDNSLTSHLELLKDNEGEF